MRTVGQILKQARETRFYMLDEVEKATKIRKELLEALEADDYSKLPPPTFTQGFIKSYGKFLGLDTTRLVAIFRREFADEKNPPKILESFQNPIDKKRLIITPTKFLGSVVLLMVVAFFVYLWFEYRFLVGAPFLEVVYPQDQISIESDSIQVSGRTDPEAKVSINNQEIQTDISGRFQQEISLKEAINTIVITATSKSGKVTRVDRAVFLRR